MSVYAAAQALMRSSLHRRSCVLATLAVCFARPSRSPVGRCSTLPRPGSGTLGASDFIDETPILLGDAAGKLAPVAGATSLPCNGFPTRSTSSMLPLQRRGPMASALRMAGGKKVVPTPAPVAAANVRKKSRRVVELMTLPFEVRNEATRSHAAGDVVTINHRVRSDSRTN